MSPEQTLHIMRRYWNAGITDTRLLAEDVIFTMMADGRKTHGREAVMHMLKHFYHVAFDAQLEVFSEVVGEGRAVAEGFLTGTHIGEFAGIPVTGKKVHVPLCVSYELESNQIKRIRMYLALPVLWAQLGVAGYQPDCQRLNETQDI